jgi:hypothetical protein
LTASVKIDVVKMRLIKDNAIERIFPGHLENNLGTKGTPFEEQ